MREHLYYLCEQKKILQVKIAPHGYNDNKVKTLLVPIHQS